ncbi:MAG: YbaB/EbfC family nucleoid-associated protein [Holosporales bacterium]
MQNIGQLVKQAQMMQQKMAEMQEQLAKETVEGQSAGGMVKVVMTGKGEVTSVKVDPSLVDPKEVEVLEDLVMAALNDARTKSDAKANEAMAKISGGMKLPGGFKLPF